MSKRHHPAEIKQLLPKRVDISHKGSYGHLLIIAGSEKYTGAASLMVEAALRTGVGIVYIIATNSTAGVIRNRTPEAVVIEAPETNGSYDKRVIGIIENTLKEFKISAIGIGPGIGSIKDSQAFYDGFIHIVNRIEIPLLVDADALEPIYQRMLKISNKNNRVVFTPHPKEFLRMINKTSLLNIKEAVTTAAKNINQTIVYKSHASIVVNSESFWETTTGNSALATAGSGDVLSGIIAGFLAQGLNDFNAAKLGVYLHGLIAELVSDKLGLHSLLARDLCDNIAKGIQELG